MCPLHYDTPGKPSFLGAMDEACLALVSAGICAGQLLLPVPSLANLTPLARRGLFINSFWADFVEAQYPYMEADWFVGFTAYGECCQHTDHKEERGESHY